MATSNSCSHASLKLDPARWDAELKNRRSQAVMIPGTDIAECRACGSSLTLVIDRAAYDAWNEEMSQWDDPTAPGFVDTPPCPAPLTDDVRGREGFEPAVQQ